jgi:hypothetical protein
MSGSTRTAPRHTGYSKEQSMTRMSDRRSSLSYAARARLESDVLHLLSTLPVLDPETVTVITTTIETELQRRLAHNAQQTSDWLDLS